MNDYLSLSENILIVHSATLPHSCSYYIFKEFKQRIAKLIYLIFIELDEEQTNWCYMVFK